MAATLLLILLLLMLLLPRKAVVGTLLLPPLLARLHLSRHLLLFTLQRFSALRLHVPSNRSLPSALALRAQTQQYQPLQQQQSRLCLWACLRLPLCLCRCLQLGRLAALKRSPVSHRIPSLAPFQSRQLR